jgi:hypothetical protein
MNIASRSAGSKAIRAAPGQLHTLPPEKIVKSFKVPLRGTLANFFFALLAPQNFFGGFLMNSKIFQMQKHQKMRAGTIK